MRWYVIDPIDSEHWCDQNADTNLMPHGYWSLSLAENRQQWHLRLWEQNADLDEIVAEPYNNRFASEAEAKQFAQTCEARGALPRDTRSPSGPGAPSPGRGAGL